MKIFLAVFFLGMTLSLQAQHKPISYNFGAGVNMGYFRYTNVPPAGYDINPSASAGFQIYGTVNIPISEKVLLGFELGDYQFNNVIKNQDYGFNYQDVSTSINYLEFSVLPKYNLKHSRLSVFVGPSLGIKLGSKLKYSGSVDPNEPNIGEVAVNDYKPINVSFVAGVDYHFAMGLGLAIKYQYGLTDIAGSKYGNGTAKFSGLSFSLDYLLY